MNPIGGSGVLAGVDSLSAMLTDRRPDQRRARSARIDYGLAVLTKGLRITVEPTRISTHQSWPTCYPIIKRAPFGAGKFSADDPSTYPRHIGHWFIANIGSDIRTTLQMRPQKSQALSFTGPNIDLFD